MEKKFALKIVALCLLCSLITGIVVHAATPTNIMTLSGGNYPCAFSYTIFTDGTNYFAKNQLGVIDYSGTEADTVLQAAIDAMDSGKIFLSSGSFEVTNLLTIAAGQEIQLIGEGKYSTILDFGELEEGLIVGDASVYTSEFAIKDMQLTGTVGTTILLQLRNIIFPQIQNCLFINFKRGVIIDAYEGAGAAYFADIQNCDFEGGDTTDSLSGFMATGANVTSKTTTGHILGSRFKACNIGCYLQYCSDWTITGGDFENNNYGLSISVYSYRNTIYSSNFETNAVYDVDISDNSIGNIFRDCNFGSVDSVYISANSEAKIYNSIGYYAQAWGTETISSSTSVTFNHGLSGVPLHVFASFNDTATGAWKWNASSTQITVTVASSGTFTVYWLADIFEDT